MPGEGGRGVRLVFMGHDGGARVMVQPSQVFALREYIRKVNKDAQPERCVAVIGPGGSSVVVQATLEEVQQKLTS